MNKIYAPEWPRLFMKLVFFTLLLYASVSKAQTKYAISGQVTDGKSNETMPGVTVSLKGTALGVITNVDGKYTLSATLKPGTYDLVFTFTGYKPYAKSIVLGSETGLTVNAQLQPSVSSLDEVVVTGTSAGTTRKQLGSYVSTVNADELDKGVASNAFAALQGKTAGAQITQNSGDPAGGFSVRLRGITSINGSSEPLYIVDGVVVDNSTNRVTNADASYSGTNSVGSVGQSRLVDINPDDIDHIEVLNGAAAAAIYGSRANAGVIQIFTKRGKSGEPEVSFSSSLTTSSLRKQLVMNSAPIMFGSGPEVQTQTLLTPTITNTTPVSRYNYQDYIFQTAFGTDDNVSIKGGKDNTTYYTSVSFYDNQGIIRNTDYRRISFRTNLDQKLSNWAKVSFGVNYINSSDDEKPDGNSFYSPINSINIIGNYYNLGARDASGNLLAVGERGRVNPVSVIEDIKQAQSTNRIIANASLKLYPIKNLIIDNTFGVDNYSQNGTEFIPPFAYNVSPSFFGGGATLNPATNGYASNASDFNLQLNNELNATYEWQITQKLGSTTQVGYSYQFQNGTFTLLQAQGLSPFVQTIVGANTPLPGDDERSSSWISGEFLQQNFKYNNQLFVTGAVRVDGASVFATNERNQTYFKAASSYVLSSADYWNSLGVSKWWDVFKLRAAFGQSGNLTGLTAYQRFNSYSSQAFDGKTAFYSSTTVANENAKPERSNELEVGTDMSFFSDRLGFTFNWYYKKVTDLLFPRQIAPTNGFTSALDNFGSMQNKGFEVVLNGTPIKSHDFKWDASLLFNHNRNEVLNIGTALKLFSTNSGAPVAVIQGQPVGVFYGTFYARDPSGKIITNAAGIPQIAEGVQNSATSYTEKFGTNGLPTGTTLQKVIGNPNPDYTATFINEFSYQKLSLRVQLDDSHGGNVFNADYRTRQGVDNGLVAQQEDLGQLPRGYIAGIYSIQEFRIDDASYIKLREISLGYNAGKIKYFKNLRILLSGRNLYSWDKYKGYDPEVNSGGQSTLLRGIDFGAVPIPRTISLGVQATF